MSVENLIPLRSPPHSQVSLIAFFSVAIKFHTSKAVQRIHINHASSGYNRASGQWLMLSPPPPAPTTPFTPNAPELTVAPSILKALNAPSLPNAPTAENVYGSQGEHLNYGYEDSQYPQQQHY